MPGEREPVSRDEIPEEYRRAALVCSNPHCGFGVTVDGTEHWPQTIGLAVEDVRCRDHGDSMVRGWLDDRELWR